MTINLRLRFKRELEKGEKRERNSPSDSIHNDCKWDILSLILLMRDTPNILYNPSIISLWKEKHTPCEEKNAKLSNRNCQYISVVMPLSFHRKAELKARKRPSSSDNMPFLHVEDALLDARRACSQFVFVTIWFIECYKDDCRERHTSS